MAILYKELSYRITGCAMHVHREIGPGLGEPFYHTALYDRLLASGIPRQYKPGRRLIHRDIVADEFEADLIVDGAVILELKSLTRKFAAAHFTQLISYLKCWKMRLGLLFDFGKQSLLQKRVVHTDRPAYPSVLSDESPPLSNSRDRDLYLRILSSLREIGRRYGPGYRDTTYQGIFRADLMADGLAVERREAEIWCGGRNLGATLLNCFIVEGRCAVQILALYDRLHASHRAVLQTCLKHLRLPWGILVNYGKEDLDCQYVWRS
jgi:GxxExxY protein